MSAGAVGDIAWWYLIGEVIGALFFGRLSDKLGTQNLFIVTLGVYLIGSGLTAATPNGRPLVHLPVRHPDHRGHGHRRRVRRDQLRDRRDDPRQVPGPGRHRGQRNLLGRRHPGHDRDAVPAEPHLPSAGLAGGLHRRPGARAGHHLRPAEPAGEPALADHARQARRRRRLPSRRSKHDVSATKGTLPPVDESKEIEISRPSRSATRPCSRCCSGITRAGRCSVAALMITQSFLYNAIFFTYGLVSGVLLPRQGHRHRLLLLRVRGRATCSAR